jgi:hypothetical protein
MEPDSLKLVEAMAQVWQPPFQVIQRAVDQEWIFPVTHHPSEIESDDEPPVLLGERSEVIAIDGLLGLYSPDTLQITIFRKGISRVAELLNARVADLTFIVRIHEWAHALLHVGFPEAERLQLTKQESLWPKHLAAATGWFRTLDAPLHERLAQLLTHHGVCSLRAAATFPQAQGALERIARTFGDLTRRAPSDYHIDKYTTVPKGRILSSVRLLKSGGLVGASAWETVVTW